METQRKDYAMRTIILAASAALTLGGPALADGPHRFGGGVNYWVALKDIKVDDIDDKGFSHLVTYQYRGSLWGLGLDAEMLPDRFGRDAYAGQAYLIVGSGLYGAAGVGIVRTGGDFADDPFFVFRAGIDLELLPSLRLDINAQYRFNETADLKDDDRDIDTNTLFLGAALRLAF